MMRPFQLLSERVHEHDIAPMAIDEHDPAIEGYLLKDLRREFRIGWDKLLVRLGLPINIGLDSSMTLAEARIFAANRSKSRGQQVTDKDSRRSAQTESSKQEMLSRKPAQDDTDIRSTN